MPVVYCDKQCEIIQQTNVTHNMIPQVPATKCACYIQNESTNQTNTELITLLNTQSCNISQLHSNPLLLDKTLPDWINWINWIKTLD